MYGEDDNRFFFPRFYFKNKKDIIGNIVDATSLGKAIAFHSNIKLWDYQAKAIEEFKQHIAGGKTGIFLGAAPGSAKLKWESRC